MSDQSGERPRCAPTTPALLQVGTREQFRPGTVGHVVVGDTELALVNSEGNFAAVRDLCLRCGSRLSSGALAAGQLTCSTCGWQYDVMRGLVVGLPALRIERHEVIIANDCLFVRDAVDALAQSPP